jgi:hypothetical protein
LNDLLTCWLDKISAPEQEEDPRHHGGKLTGKKNNVFRFIFCCRAPPLLLKMLFPFSPILVALTVFPASRRGLQLRSELHILPFLRLQFGLFPSQTNTA